MRFLIWAWDYGDDSGGGIMLHRLAHELAVQGHDARLSCGITAPGWLGKLSRRKTRVTASGGYHDQINTVTVYPEIVEGNPFSSQRVVRWVLNRPGFFGAGNGDGVYGEHDLVMLGREEYRASVTAGYIGGLLTACRPLDHFRDYHGARAGECYLIRKARNSGRPFDCHGADALCIDNYGAWGDSYLISVFNGRQRLVCYDNNCFIPTLANLCGVPEIVLPFGGDPPLTRAGVLDAETVARRQTTEFANLCAHHW